MNLTKNELDLLIYAVDEAVCAAKRDCDRANDELSRLRHRDSRGFWHGFRDSARKQGEKLIEMRTKLRDELREVYKS